MWDPTIDWWDPPARIDYRRLSLFSYVLLSQIHLLTVIVSSQPTHTHTQTHRRLQLLLLDPSFENCDMTIAAQPSTVSWTLAAPLHKLQRGSPLRILPIVPPMPLLRSRNFGHNQPTDCQSISDGVVVSVITPFLFKLFGISVFVCFGGSESAEISVFGGQRYRQFPEIGLPPDHPNFRWDFPCK